MVQEAKASSENKSKSVKNADGFGWFKGGLRFIKDSYGELKRITWPEKSKIIKSSSVVLSSIALITIFIWLVDSIFNQALDYFIKILR